MSRPVPNTPTGQRGSGGHHHQARSYRLRRALASQPATCLEQVLRGGGREDGLHGGPLVPYLAAGADLESRQDPLSHLHREAAAEHNGMNLHDGVAPSSDFDPSVCLALPMPATFRTGSVLTNSSTASLLAGSTNCPLGFLMSLAILLKSRFGATPGDGKKAENHPEVPVSSSASRGSGPCLTAAAGQAASRLFDPPSNLGRHLHRTGPMAPPRALRRTRGTPACSPVRPVLCM